MSFYVTLPSNVTSRHFFNTQSNFTTLLDNPLNFSVPYEVALVEFSYREYMSFDIGSINVRFPDKTEDGFDEEIFRKLRLYAFDNEPIDHIIDRINFEIIEHYAQVAYCAKKGLIYYSDSDHSDYIKTNWTNFRSATDYDEAYYELVYNKYVKLCPQINLYNKSNNHAFVTVPDKIAIFFEGHAKQLFKNDKTHITKNYDFLIMSELLNFVDYLMIYCDLVEPQTVGDTFAPLLRTICKTGEFNRTTEKIYTNPHYLPVCKSYINTINIDVRDPSGEKVKFENQLSKVYLKLHFRTIRNE